MLKKIIKITINRHEIAQDMQRSKKIDRAFAKEMEDVKGLIASLEDRHLSKFNSAAEMSNQIDSRVSETNNVMFEMKMDLKRLIQHNTDKISQLKVHANAVDKFEEITKRKIEEIVTKARENRNEAQERDEALERRVGLKLDRLKSQSDEKFELLQKGKFTLLDPNN